MTICEATTKRYLFGLVGITKVRHCLHTQSSRRIFDDVCEDPAPKRCWRKKCCHCEVGSTWRVE